MLVCLTLALVIFVSNVASGINILQSVWRSPFGETFLAVGKACLMCCKLGERGTRKGLYVKFVLINQIQAIYIIINFYSTPLKSNAILKYSVASATYTR